MSALGTLSVFGVIRGWGERVEGRTRHDTADGSTVGGDGITACDDGAGTGAG